MPHHTPPDLVSAPLLSHTPTPVGSLVKGGIKRRGDDDDDDDDEGGGGSHLSHQVYRAAKSLIIPLLFLASLLHQCQRRAKNALCDHRCVQDGFFFSVREIRQVEPTSSLLNDHCGHGLARGLSRASLKTQRKICNDTDLFPMHLTWHGRRFVLQFRFALPNASYLAWSTLRPAIPLCSSQCILPGMVDASSCNSALYAVRIDVAFRALTERAIAL